MKAIVCVGISASGKTTWARNHLEHVLISRDDYRRKILSEKLDRELLDGELWFLWKWKDEDRVTAMVQADIAKCAENGKNIIIADTNLVEKYRTLMVSRLEELGYEVIIKPFPISFEDAMIRDARRADGVGVSVLMKQWKQWNKTMMRPTYSPSQFAPKAVMVDVDGTLATMGDRGPFDWNKVGDDLVRQEIADMVRGYKAMGYFIVVMSGRDSVCRKETVSWLNDNNIPFSELFMREENDNRPDQIIKEELFWHKVANHYNVKLVIDDRPKVVRMWHDLGLSVAAVANQHLEF
jgi:predicted kinase